MELQRSWATRKCRKQIFPPPSALSLLACVMYARTVTVSLLFDTKCQSCSWVAAVCSFQCKWIHLVADKDSHTSLYWNCDCQWSTSACFLAVVQCRSCLVFCHEMEFSRKQELSQLKAAWLCAPQERVLWKTLRLAMLQVKKKIGILKAVCFPVFK